MTEAAIWTECPACKNHVVKGYDCPMCGFNHQANWDADKVKQIEDRITSSMAIPRSAYHRNGNKEFWYGFITGLRDYEVLTQEEFKILHYQIDRGYQG